MCLWEPLKPSLPKDPPLFWRSSPCFGRRRCNCSGFAPPGERAVLGCSWGHGNWTAPGPGAPVNLPGPEILRAVAEGQPRTLQSVPGIGRKMAERLVLELKDKVGVPRSWQPLPRGRPIEGLKADALALENLGYRRTDAEAALDQAFRQEGPLNLAQVLRLALKQLGTRG